MGVEQVAGGSGLSGAPISGREERLNAMLDHLVEVGSASAKSLAKLFDISIMTVHRDLDALERRGAVRKFHGGATVDRTGSYEIAATIRRRFSATEKRAIGQAAAKIVRAGQTVMIDDSTTAATMAEPFGDFESLRVVTNYLPAINEMISHARIAVHALGGAYDVGHESFLGVAAIEAVRALRVDVVFASTTTVDFDGLYHQEEQVVALKAEMLRRAKRRVLLLDGSKFGQTSFHRICGWDQIDDLFTTADAPPALLREIERQGVKVHLVEVHQ